MAPSAARFEAGQNPPACGARVVDRRRHESVCHDSSATRRPGLMASLPQCRECRSPSRECRVASRSPTLLLSLGPVGRRAHSLGLRPLGAQRGKGKLAVGRGGSLPLAKVSGQDPKSHKNSEVFSVTSQCTTLSSSQRASTQCATRHTWRVTTFCKELQKSDVSEVA